LVAGAAVLAAVAGVAAIAVVVAAAAAVAVVSATGIRIFHNTSRRFFRTAG
jgi:hypothetical protein